MDISTFLEHRNFAIRNVAKEKNYVFFNKMNNKCMNYY